MQQQIEEISVPELGEGIEAADVVSLLVAVGDQVVAEQPLVEVESDKASLEIPSPSAGKIEEIRVAVGEKIQVGQPIMTLALQGGAADRSDEKLSDEKPAVPIPEASPQATGAPVASPAPQTASIPAAAPPSVPPSVSPSALPATFSSGAPLPAVTRLIAAAPSVRRVARELGVDIAAVTGTGPAGRISIEDVKAHVKALLQGGGQTTATALQPELPDLSAWGPLRREAMSSIQQKTAEKMHLAWSQIPHVTQHDDADITIVERFRKERSATQGSGGKLTVTAIMLKILGLALARFPRFNASIDIRRQEIVYREYINIGVAVDTPYGLVVPVIRAVDRKGILELSAELNDMAFRAREKRLRPEELRGGGFSLTNLGGLGCGYFTPIVTWPEVAVLGMGRAALRPIWEGQSFQPRLIMPLSISYDHRIINGADAARFLRWIAEAIEQPLSSLL